MGQTYFAVQTRMQEIRQMEEYNALPSENEKRLLKAIQQELRMENGEWRIIKSLQKPSSLYPAPIRPL